MSLPTLLMMVVVVALTPPLDADTGSRPDTGTMTLALASPKAWAFNTATVASPRGLSGRIELFGIGADGAATLLCVGSAGWAASIDMPFYADAGLRALTAEGHSADGQIARVTTRLPAGFAASAADEAATRLASRDFPSSQRGTMAAPAKAMVAGGSTDEVAVFAMSTLFTRRRNPGPLVALALWSLVAIAVPLVAMKQQHAPGVSRAAIVVASSLAASLLVANLSTPHPMLYSIGMRSPVAVVAEAEPRQLRYAPASIPGEGFGDVSWDAPEAARTGLRFVLADAVGTRGLPLDALQRYRRIRFKVPPVITLPDKGRALLVSGVYMAWGLDE